MRRLFLAFVFLLFPAVAQAQWREASTPHFLIYSLQSEEELRKSAEELERFDGALRAQLSKPDKGTPPATRVTIYILKDRRALQQFLGSESIAGIYMPRPSGSISFTYEDRPGGIPSNAGSIMRQPSARERLNPRLVLFHEYTHHFLNHNFSFGAPLWFSEGFAEFWGPTEFNPDGSVKIGLVQPHRSAELSQLPRLSMERVIKLRFPIESQMTYVSLYGYGWVLSHYLAFEPSRAGQLDRYLAALARGASADEASKVFGDLDKLDQEVRAYMSRGRYAFGTIPAEKVKPGPIKIRELRPGENAIMSIRMQSKRGVNDEMAKGLVGEARSIGARFPTDPLVQATLAEVEYDAKNFVEAEAAADRAIAADPRSVEGHLFKARAMQGRFQKAGPITPAQWTSVRAAIQAANRADPDDPEPLLAFYDTFKPAGQKPTTNALDGLLYAHELAPEARPLRLTAGRELLAAGNVTRAKSVLGPIAGDSHSGELGTTIAQVLDTLAKDGAAAALKQLDEAMAKQERAARRRS